MGKTEKFFVVPELIPKKFVLERRIFSVNRLGFASPLMVKYLRGTPIYIWYDDEGHHD